MDWCGWAPHDATKSAEAQAAANAKEEAVLVMPTMPTFTLQQRAQAARVANAVRALAILYLPIHSRTIQDTCQVDTPPPPGGPPFSLPSCAGPCKGGLAVHLLLTMPSCPLQKVAGPEYSKASDGCFGKNRSCQPKAAQVKPGLSPTILPNVLTMQWMTLKQSGSLHFMCLSDIVCSIPVSKMYAVPQTCRQLCRNAPWQ